MYDNKNETKTNKPSDTTSTSKDSGDNATRVSGVRYVPICYQGHRNCTRH